MTNSEYLRKMSDEEIASILEFKFCFNDNLNVKCPYRENKPETFDIYESCSDLCHEAFLKWLKQEVDEC